MVGFLRRKLSAKKDVDDARLDPVRAPADPPPSLPPILTQSDAFLVDPDSIPGFSPNLSPPLPARLQKYPATRTSIDGDWLTSLAPSLPIKPSGPSTPLPESNPSTYHTALDVPRDNRVPPRPKLVSFAPSSAPVRAAPPPSDNQAPSFSPSTTRRPPASQRPSAPISRSASSSTKYTDQNNSPSSTSLSSNATLGSSYRSDKPRRTTASYGTPSTSTSSFAPVSKVIDVNKPTQDSLDFKSSRKTSNSRNASLPRSSSTQVSPASRPPLPTRQFTTPSTTTRSQRTTISSPPTSYPERGRSTPSRHASTSNHNNKPSQPSNKQVQPPMRFDALRIRTVSAELCGAPSRKGPLIFTAVKAENAKPLDAVRKDLNEPQGLLEGKATGRSLCPSPPPESASVEIRRKQSLSQAAHTLTETRPQSPPVVPFEPKSPLRSRKLSKGSASAQDLMRVKTADIKREQTPDSVKHRTITKSRSATSLRPNTPSNRALDPDPSQGDPLLLDDDPFAKTEGVRVLQPRSRPCSGNEMLVSPVSGTKEAIVVDDIGHEDECDDPEGLASSGTPASFVPPTPVSPEDYKAARAQRRGQWLEKTPPPLVAEVIAKQALEQEQGASEEVEQEEPPREPTPPPTYFPIVTFMSDARMLLHLLAYLSFPEWLALYSSNKEIRALFGSRILREHVLERFLGTVGYLRWDFEWAEPLALSLKDLNNYMRGVSMPTHEYARQAEAYLQPKSVNREDPSALVGPDILSLALTTRAYTRVVLRLRAQAESEARLVARLQAAERNQQSSPSSSRAVPSRAVSNSSRATSPSSSRHSHSRSHSRHPSNGEGKYRDCQRHQSRIVQKFRSPLVNLHRAPLLRVFVPSPDGEWLSDASVLDCEAELKRSGVLKLLRVGDVVWDVAVGDEGNLGRMVWDGSYLVDLDYKYSRIGELSPYFHSLAFAPSYFHRVIRTGVSATHNPNGNPIVYIDVSPWGEELARNLQLLQDRSRTETPHGALHSVLRWVHRSSFAIRPPVVGAQHSPTTSPAHAHTPRLPVPNVEDGFFIDPGWYGTVVVEAEGTNEGLADLQARCGPGVFPPRAQTMLSQYRSEKERAGRRVWRVVRERSRPGEIWVRAVREKERVM